MNATCPSCRAELAADARYCGRCGAATRAHLAKVAATVRGARRADGRAGLALLLACAGPLLQPAFAPLVGDTDTWSSVTIDFVVLLLITAAAAVVAGRVREALPVALGGWWCAAAVPAAGFTLLVSIAYVAQLPRPAEPAEVSAVTAATWAAVVVFAPVGEELLCRGAAFRAAAIIGSPALAVVVSALLFAFLHGLNGGWLLELPHRFVMGCVVGWLRLRSGSLVPGVLAHALHNLVAMLDG